MFRGTGYYWVDKWGKLNYKPTLVVNAIGAKEYFNSPNVVKHWHIKSLADYNKIKHIINVAKAG